MEFSAGHLHRRSPSNEAETSNRQPHRRGVPWTLEEHRLFLIGLNEYGKGGWKKISRHYVISKTPTQVASHAQKYFRREKCPTPLDKRRPSIHDIRTVDPTPVTSVPQPQINCCDELGSCGPINPLFNGGFSGGVMEQNTMFPPINNSVFPSDDLVFDQASASSYMFYEGFTGGVMEQNTTFLPMSNAVFPSDDPVLDQASTSSYMFYEGFSGGVIDQSTMFLPMTNSVSLSDYPTLDQAFAGSSMLSTLPNQQWH